MSDTDQRLGIYEFDAFRLDVVERSLWRRQKRIPLGGRAFDVLATLVRQGGRLVTKEELLQQAWKGRVVEEGNIHVQISTLRRLLGEKAISTISGHGYRFELPLERGVGATGPTESNLPAALTPLVSRDKELRELSRLLGQHRLVTVKGMGGIGKSSVATEIGRRLQQENASLRCWYVPLGAMEKGDALQSTVLHAVDRRPRAGKPIDESLLMTLREKPTLLLLDGCEVVADAAARTIRKMLEQCPELKIICTSRHSLGLVGEAVFDLPPLDLSGARKLFLERAASASRSIDPATVDKELLDRILSRLDGIPLAIELAASRLRAVGLKDLESQLSDRLGTLVGTDRSMPSRQSTLRATLEWSYRLLSGSERDFLNRIAIFQAPFTADAAAYVGLGAGKTGGDAIGLLTALIDKSLITPEVTQDSPLYRIGEIVREYACEQLRSQEMLGETRERLAQLVIKLTHNAYQVRESATWASFKRSVLQAYPDVISSIRYLIQIGEIERATQLSHNVFLYWIEGGYTEEGLQIVKPLLERRSDLSAQSRGILFHIAGGLRQDRGEFRRSAEYLSDAVTLLRDDADKKVLLGVVLNDLGVTLQYLHKQAEAVRCYSEAREIFLREDVPRREALCLTNLASLDCYLDRFEKAEGKLRRALDVYKGIDDRRGLALCLSWVAECRLEAGAFSEALELASQAVHAHHLRQDDLLSVSLLNRLATALALNDDRQNSTKTWLSALAALGGSSNQRAQIDLVEGALRILDACKDYETIASLHYSIKAWGRGRSDLATPVRKRRASDREKALTLILGKESLSSIRQNVLPVSPELALGNIRTRFTS